MTVMAKQRSGYGPPAPVEIYQWQEEFDQLLDIYRLQQPKRVLEVGTYHGGTLYHWLQNAVAGTTVVSVDSYAVRVDNRHLYNDWCPPGVQVVAIEGDSHDMAIVTGVEAFAPYDWIWIDAGHRYLEVSQDWDLYAPMIDEGGIICFHDIRPASRNHPEIEVSQLWREIKAMGTYRTQEILGHSIDWGGIGIVYT